MNAGAILDPRQPHVHAFGCDFPVAEMGNSAARKDKSRKIG
jgi:hypothetical protein